METVLEDLTVISDNAVLQKRYESELKETPLRKGEAFTKVTVTVKVNDGVNYGSATFSMNEEAKKDSSDDSSNNESSVHIEELLGGPLRRTFSCQIYCNLPSCDFQTL